MLFQIRIVAIVVALVERRHVPIQCSVVLLQFARALLQPPVSVLLGFARHGFIVTTKGHAGGGVEASHCPKRRELSDAHEPQHNTSKRSIWIVA